MTDRELMQQALRYMESIGEMDTYPEDWAIAIALRERLAQPETELETYKRLYELRGKALERPCSNCGHQPAKIKTMAQPKQEPVAWMTFNAAGEEDDIWYEHPDGQLLEGWTYRPLYTAPRREWQGLTDDDIAQAMYRADAIITGPMQFNFARAIEAKLKEKNT